MSVERANTMTVTALITVLLNLIVVFLLIKKLSVSPADVLRAHVETRQSIHKMVEDHVALPGHEGMIEYVDQLRKDVLKLSSQIELLEGEIKK